MLAAGPSRILGQARRAVTEQDLLRIRWVKTDGRIAGALRGADPEPLMLIEGEADLAARAFADGQPTHWIELLQHILNWFDEYLRDQPMDLYGDL